MAQQKTVHTIQTLHDLCVEEGECWNWTRYFANGCPYVNHEGKLQSVRKLLFTLSGKTPMQNAKFFASNCGNSKCVNPDHITSRSPKLHAKTMGQRVNHNSTVRRLKLQNVSRNRPQSKLTKELADQIFDDPRSNRKVAVDFNISASMVSNIKSGKSWKNLSAAANPWVGLL